MTPSATMITVTDSAAKHLRSLLAERAEAAGAGLRIFVENGGCSGMQYGMSFDQPQADDEIAERDGVRVLVDPAKRRVSCAGRWSITRTASPAPGSASRTRTPGAPAAAAPRLNPRPPRRRRRRTAAAR